MGLPSFWVLSLVPLRVWLLVSLGGLVMPLGGMVLLSLLLSAPCVHRSPALSVLWAARLVLSSPSLVPSLLVPSLFRWKVCLGLSPVLGRGRSQVRLLGPPV